LRRLTVAGTLAAGSRPVRPRRGGGRHGCRPGGWPDALSCSSTGSQHAQTESAVRRQQAPRVGLLLDARASRLAIVLPRSGQVWPLTARESVSGRDLSAGCDVTISVPSAAVLMAQTAVERARSQTHGHITYTPEEIWLRWRPAWPASRWQKRPGSCPFSTQHALLSITATPPALAVCDRDHERQGSLTPIDVLPWWCGETHPGSPCRRVQRLAYPSGEPGTEGRGPPRRPTAAE
jgi:hypothetical protein